MRIAWAVISSLALLSFATRGQCQTAAKLLDSKYQLSTGQFAALTINQLIPVVRALGWKYETAAEYDDSTKTIEVIVFGSDDTAEQAKQSLNLLWSYLAAFHMEDSLKELGVGLREEDYTLHYMQVKTYDKENPLREILRKEKGKFVIE